MVEKGKVSVQEEQLTLTNDNKDTITKEKQKSKKKNKNEITMESQLVKVNMKFYSEQIIGEEKDFIERVKNFNKDKIRIVATKHDRCTKRDENDTFEVANIKPHWHLTAWCVGEEKRKRVKEWLKLLGIEFRKDKDELLFINHGVEYCQYIDSSVLYQQHLTEAAQRAGKEVYELEEMVSNLTIEEIKQIEQGYKKLEPEERRPSIRNMADLANKAEEIGYNLEDFDTWWDTLPFIVQSNGKMKTIRERYIRGIEKRVAENNSVVRLSIFIEGPHDKGKTHACLKALAGKEILLVAGGGTGQYDKLKPSTDAIIVDDDKSPNVLKLADNYYCQVYRRGSNNPWWCGDYFIVTTNKNFRQWIEENGIKTQEYNVEKGQWEDTHEYKAIESRFYICNIGECIHTGKNVLMCHKPSERGTGSEQEERYNKFMAFKEEYNKSLMKYSPTENKFDYSQINGPYKYEDCSNNISPIDKKIEEIEPTMISIKEYKKLKEKMKRTSRNNQEIFERVADEIEHYSKMCYEANLIDREEYSQYINYSLSTFL